MAEWAQKLLEAFKGDIRGLISELPSAQPEYRLDEWCTDCKEYDHERHCCPRWNHVIRTTLQDAQPERKEGHWIRKSTWMWTCSCCGKDDAYAYTADDAFEPTVLQDFFCPNCGAYMRPDNAPLPDNDSIYG